MRIQLPNRYCKPREVSPSLALGEGIGIAKLALLLQELISHLNQVPMFALPPAKNWVLPLHGGLSPEQQRKVFERAPMPLRKIVVCTNVLKGGSKVINAGGGFTGTMSVNLGPFRSVSGLFGPLGTISVLLWIQACGCRMQAVARCGQ